MVTPFLSLLPHKVLSSGQRVDPNKQRRLEFLFPENIRDLDTLPLEFRGFCGYLLTAGDRILVPAVPGIGVLYHKGRYFGFSSKDAADAFASNPDG